MRFMIKAIQLVVLGSILQLDTVVDTQSTFDLKLQSASKILMQTSKGLRITDANNIVRNRQEKEGLTATWIEDELGQMLSVSIDRIDEHTTIVILAHANAKKAESLRPDLTAAQRMSTFRTITNIDNLNQLIRDRLVKANVDQTPARP